MTQPLTYEIDHRFPIAVVRLQGQLTPLTSQVARAALLESLAEEPTSVIVDLSDLAVMDDVALTLFPAAATLAAEWPGAPLLLCCAAPGVADGLEEMAIGRRMPVYATQDEALSAATDAPVPLRVRQRLEPTVQAPGEARELVTNACWDWGVPDTAAPARLVGSELVTNAVRHAGTSMDVTVTLREQFLRLSVRDGANEMARMQTPTESDDHGRGLLIVDTVAASWGSVPMGNGKAVWAALKVSPPRRTDYSDRQKVDHRQTDPRQ
jgi:anti-anti-sigma factor